MPTVEDSLRVGDANIFTKMDLASAFWQVPILPKDREKTAFQFKGRTYVWKVMPFGLSNAPASFQRLMDSIFSDLAQTYLHIYMDDLLIYSNNYHTHLR